MKNKFIPSCAIALLLAISISIFPVCAAPSFSTQSNTGTRDEVCSSLEGTGAAKYYVGEHSYDQLSSLSANDLYNALANLMTDTHTKLTSYSDCRDYAQRTDSEKGNNKITLLYTSYSAARGEYINDTAGGWNREHVWPKSLGGFNQDRAGADLHHIRPSDSRVNSVRGNLPYGEVNGGSAVTVSMPGMAGTVGGYSGGGYFEPHDNVKGDVARICLYVYVRWAKDFPQCKNLNKVFQSVDVLLKWCEEDPVDTWEMGRNEVVQSIQGNRNVFIDYPELAWHLFGEQVPEGMTTPSGEAAGGSTSCAHSNTRIKKASDPTCGKDGYTGDTYCTDCGERIQKGKTIPATGEHTFGEWIIGEDGKKSRTCTVCDLTETDDCAHPNTEIKNAQSATCLVEGYTGDIYCADCQLLLVKGTVTATNQHIFGDWIEESDGTSHRSCSVCGHTETQIPPPPPVCPHTNTECRNTVAPTCKEGYSGDTYCTDCGELLMQGLPLPAVKAHEYVIDEEAGIKVCKLCQSEQAYTPSAEVSTPDTLIIWISISAVIVLAGTAMGIVLVKKRNAR